MFSIEIVHEPNGEGSGFVACDAAQSDAIFFVYKDSDIVDAVDTLDAAQWLCAMLRIDEVLTVLNVGETAYLPEINTKQASTRAWNWSRKRGTRFKCKTAYAGTVKIGTEITRLG